MLELLQKITNQLEQYQIPYMISGSVAMIAYTTPRTTRDIDIVIELGITDIGYLMEIFQKNSYIHRPSIEDAIQKKSIFNVIDFETGYKIDFVVRKNTPYRIVEFERKIRTQAFGFEMNIVTIEDLIISKLIWIQDLQSDRQMEDIRNLWQSLLVDKAYVLDWCNQLKLNTYNLLT